VTAHHDPRDVGTGEGIELCLPLRADLVVVARLTAATVAARNRFTVDEIEDLRLAVDELCVLLGAGERRGRVHLHYLPGEDGIEIRGLFEPEAGQDPTTARWGAEGEGELGELSLRILDALVDEHDQDIVGGQRRAWLRKRRTLPEA
jgi:serine/threonine-protein kinase RsbW